MTAKKEKKVTKSTKVVPVKAAKVKKKSKFEPGDFILKAKRSSAGIGLFTESDIPKGVCIIEYVGRVISPEEEYTSNSKYLFEINSKTTIDGAARTNLARYINHSCRPNAEPEIRKGRIYIMSRRSIKPGEEIVYDYGKEYWGHHIKPHGCRCLKCKEKSK
jgi:SET domain-containing protein